MISSRWHTNVFFFHRIFFVYPSLSFTKLRLNHHVNLVKHPGPMAGLLTLHQTKWNCTWNTGCLFMVTRMNAYVFAIALNSVGLFSAKPKKKHLWAIQPLPPTDPERWRLKAKTHTYSKSFIEWVEIWFHHWQPSALWYDFRSPCWARSHIRQNTLSLSIYLYTYIIYIYYIYIYIYI